MRLRLALVGALFAGAVPAIGAAPASAASGACTSGTGVTVVVGSDVRCDTSPGGTANTNFTDVGHTLTYTAKFPGFVCRVDGAPASDPCFTASPSNAYWALFWSDGRSGSWVYSQSGVTSLSVPTGGWVAWVFQSSNSTVYPSVTPLGPAPSATANSGGTTTSTSTTSPGATGSAGTGGSPSSTTPPASAGSTPDPGAATEPTNAPPPSDTDSTNLADEQSTGLSATRSGSGWTGWALAAVVTIGLSTTAGLTWWRRRRAH